MSGTCSALMMQAPLHASLLRPVLDTLAAVAAGGTWHTRAQALPFMQYVAVMSFQFSTRALFRAARFGAVFCYAKATS